MPATVRADPPPLPDRLKAESPVVKFLWAYLGGELTLSTRELTRLTGVSQPTVDKALRRLRDLGLLEVVKEASGSAPPTFRMVGERPPR